nr:hypothetical protein [Candidatus Sigynarchaeota archaeon]
MSEKHKWTKEDNVIAFYLYQFGMESLGDPTVMLECYPLMVSSKGIALLASNVTDLID